MHSSTNRPEGSNAQGVEFVADRQCPPKSRALSGKYAVGIRSAAGGPDSAHVRAYPWKRLPGIESIAGGIRKIDIKLFGDISLTKMHTMTLTKRGGRFFPRGRRRARLGGREEGRGPQTRMAPGADRPAPEKMSGRGAR